MAVHIPHVGIERPTIGFRTFLQQRTLKRMGNLLVGLPDQFQARREGATVEGRASLGAVSLSLTEFVEDYGYVSTVKTNIDITRSATEPEKILALEASSDWILRASKTTERFTLGAEDNQLSLGQIVGAVRLAAELTKPS